MRRLLIFAVTGICITEFSTQAAILNGSFEVPVLGSSGYASTAAPADWSVGATTGWWLFRDPVTDWPAAQDGDQYMDIGNTSISQIFTIAVAGTYRLSWYDNVGVAPVYNEARYVVSVSGGNAIIASQTFDAYNSQYQWSLRGIDLTLAAGEYTLKFDASTTWYHRDTLLDNVSLTAAAVPEPSTFAAAALLLLPLGAGLARRLRRH